MCSVHGRCDLGALHQLAGDAQLVDEGIFTQRRCPAIQRLHRTLPPSVRFSLRGPPARLLNPMVVTPNTQAIQRRYQNVVKDSTRQLQYNMILGRKLCVPPPWMDFFFFAFSRDLFSVLTPLSLASPQCGMFPFARAEPIAIRVREQLPGVLAQDRALSVLRPRTREVAPSTLLIASASQPADG